MSVAYVDASCVVAAAFSEPGAAQLWKRLGRFDRVVSSPLLESEVYAALRREGRSLDADCFGPVELVLTTGSLNMQIRRVLEAGYLRGADCWHLATALYLAPDPNSLTFVTLDLPQRTVAKALGFKV